MNEIVCTLDVEAHGDDVLRNNLRSFGIAAMTLDKELIASITFNLADEPGRVNDPKTSAWWEQHPEAYASATANQVAAAHAFRQYRTWWNRLRKYGYAYLAGAPVGYDAVFFNVYCFQYLGKLPHQRMALDMRSLASGTLGKPYAECSKEQLPRDLFDDLPYPHIALDDALNQACLIVNLTRRSRGLPRLAGYLDKRQPADIFDATTRPAQ